MAKAYNKENMTTLAYHYIKKAEYPWDFLNNLYCKRQNEKDSIIDKAYKNCLIKNDIDNFYHFLMVYGDAEIGQRIEIQKRFCRMLLRDIIKPLYVELDINNLEYPDSISEKLLFNKFDTVLYYANKYRNLDTWCKYYHKKIEMYCDTINRVKHFIDSTEDSMNSFLEYFQSSSNDDSKTQIMLPIQNFIIDKAIEERDTAGLGFSVRNFCRHERHNEAMNILFKEYIKSNKTVEFSNYYNKTCGFKYVMVLDILYGKPSINLLNSR